MKWKKLINFKDINKKFKIKYFSNFQKLIKVRVEKIFICIISIVKSIVKNFQESMKQKTVQN